MTWRRRHCAISHFDPWQTCPACGARRGWPTVRCPECGRRVGREILLAVVSALVAIGFTQTLGLVWALIPFLGFLVLTLALGITDVDALRIVDRLNLRGSLLVIGGLGLAALVDGNEAAFVRGLLGGAAFFAATNLVYLVVRGRGFGYGDVKLSVQLGVFTAYVSWGTLGWAVFLTTFLGGLLSLLVLAGGLAARVRERRAGQGATTIRDAMRAELPYGPAMIAGAWLAIVLAGLGAFPVPT